MRGDMEPSEDEERDEDDDGEDAPPCSEPGDGLCVE